MKKIVLISLIFFALIEVSFAVTVTTDKDNCEIIEKKIEKAKRCLLDDNFQDSDCSLYNEVLNSTKESCNFDEKCIKESIKNSLSLNVLKCKEIKK